MATHESCARPIMLCADAAHGAFLAAVGFDTALLVAADDGRDAIDGDVAGRLVVLVPPTDAEGEHFRTRALAALPDDVTGVKALPIAVDYLDIWLAPPGASDDLRWHIAEAVYLVPPPGGSEADGVAGRPAVTWEPVITRVSDVVARQVLWLWRSFIALGKITVLDGDPGLGKSSITMDLAARVTRQDAMPDGSRGDLGEPGGVVLVIAEDGIADTVRPRLEAVGADLDRIAVIEGLVKGDDERPFTLTDIPALERAVVEMRAALVVVDPFMAYLDADTNAHHDQAIRAILTPLARLAERLNVAIVLIRHLNKAVGGSALYRGGGSIGIIGAARGGLLVGRDPHDPEGRRCALAVAKSNLGAIPPSLAYHIEGTSNGASQVIWDGPSSHTATTLLALPIDAGERTVKDDAEDVLRAILADGPLPADAVKREAKAAGITDATLRRAQSALGIKPKREGYGTEGKWVWALPSEEQTVA